MDNNSASAASAVHPYSNPYDVSATDVLYQWSANAAAAASARLAPSATPPSAARMAGAVDGGQYFMAAQNESQFDYGNESLDSASFQQMDGGQCRQMDSVGNMSYWNLTCDSPLDYAMPLYGYCMPFLLIITIISNSLIVLVLSKKSMATPTNFVLMGRCQSPPKDIPDR